MTHQDQITKTAADAGWDLKAYSIRERDYHVYTHKTDIINVYFDRKGNVRSAHGYVEGDTTEELKLFSYSPNKLARLLASLAARTANKVGDVKVLEEDS